MSTTTSTKKTSTPGVSESASLLSRIVASPPEPEMRLGKCWDSSRRIQVDVLACLFGVSAWLSVNALFTQLPLLVQTAPEGWNLPSYLAMIIQVANIGPILYSLSQRYCPKLVPDSKLIYFILVLGTSSLILIAFLYDHIWVLFGEPHSGVLFVLTFCIALVGCTSSVVFIPFMNHYPEVYLISYMVGEGLSGLLPSIISLVQGIGGNPTCHNVTQPDGTTKLLPSTPEPLFSTEVFFMIIFSIMLVSTISFFLLNNLPSCKEQKVRKPSVRKPSENDSPILDPYMEPVPIIRSPNSPRTMAPAMYKTLLIVQAVVSLLANGALPSVQSYSCLPYGNLAYHFAVNLSNMANPAACFLAFFMPRTSIVAIFSLLSVAAMAVTYVVITALMSPNPPLVTSHLGNVLIVISWVACSGLMSYVKMSIATIFRREGGKGLFWYGVMTQVGAVIGSVIMYIVINHSHLFKSYDACR